MASNTYNPALLRLVRERSGANSTFIDFQNDTIKVLGVSPDGTSNFNKDDEFVSNVATYELTNSVGTGYERKTLSGKSIAFEPDPEDLGSHRLEFTCDDILFSNINTNETFSALILYKEITTDSDSPLICFVDFDDIVTDGSDVGFATNPNGIFHLKSDLVS